jgi:hypothetical protein
VLDVSGPWAVEFQQAYAQAHSDYERGVLRDGTVTAVEYEQTKQHVRSCLGDAGYTIEWDARGGFELGSASGTYPDDFFAESDPVLRSCESRWVGSITYLFEQVRRNPEKKDEAAIQLSCLRRAGLVDPAYSRERLQRDTEKDTLPYDATSDAAQRCAVDPLGLWYTG